MHLARASYLYDYRLANRYAKETLRLMYDWCGMPIANKWRRLIGVRAAFLLCFVIMGFRLVFWRKERRGPGPITSLMYFGRALLSTLGVRMTALDREAAIELTQMIGLLRGGPSFTPARGAYLVADALSVQPFGREAELARRLKVARKETERRLLIDMSEAERQDIQVGLLLSGGINECYRIGSKALAMADEMAAMGTRIAQAAAHRIRFTYYVVRGMREKAEEYRRELGIFGIQGGTTWQVDWFAVPTEGMASALLGDVVGTGQALARLERLSGEIPSLVAPRDMVRVGYHMRRGETEQAIALGKQFVERFPPRTMIGWGTAYSAYAAALNHEGRHREALELCERALSVLTPEDMEYVIMYGPLLREHAFALAGAGQPDRAIKVADSYVAKLEQHGEYALVAHAHECRVKVARVIRDQGLLMNALIAMRDAAERTASSTVIEQAAKITQANLRATRDIELVMSEQDEPESEDSAGSDQTPAGGIARTRKRTLLRRVMERARARSAFVLAFSENDGAPRLVTSAGESLSLSSLVGAVRGLVASQGEVETDRPVQLRARVSIEARPFEVIALPRKLSADPAILMLLESPEVQDAEFPATLLARLAEGVRSELSLTHESSESVPDSDVSQTFG
jgi:tetratricopeptide (TPR) repeat protein